MRVLELDRESLTVTRPGRDARARARAQPRRARASRSGHFPQSFEYVSLGGCAATRSAGQASTGYGAIEQMVLGLRLAAPARRDRAAGAARPAPPAPGLRQLLVGSEGTLGVITELALRVRPAPRERIYEGVFFEDFAAGVQALRAPRAGARAARRGAALRRAGDAHVARAGGQRAALKGRLGRAYLGRARLRRGLPGDLGFEGGEEEVACRRAARLSSCAARRAARSGARPGEAWLQGRFSGPYLRDELLTQGVMVETLETATQWSNLLGLQRQVGRRSRARSTRMARRGW